MKKSIIFTLFLVILSTFGIANSFTEGGAGQIGAGGNTRRAYSWLITNPVTNPDYNACQLNTGSITTPMSASSIYDIDTYGATELVIAANAAGIFVYDYNCNLIDSIDEAVASNIVITNFDANEYQEITFTDGDEFKSYQYNETNGTFTIVVNETHISAAKWTMACTRHFINAPTRCALFRPGFTSARAARVEANFSTTVGAVTSSNPFNRPEERGISFYPDDAITPEELTVICHGVTDTTWYADCDAVDQFLNIEFTMRGSTVGGSGSATLKYSNEVIVNMNGVDRILLSTEHYAAVSNQTAGLSEFRMNDIAGVEIFKEQFQTTGDTNVSNPVVGNFLKNSSKLACVTATFNNKISEFICYNQNGAVQHNLSINITNEQIVMGDFNSSDGYLCLGASSGIYCYDGVENLTRRHDGIDIGALDYKLSHIAISQPASSQAPAYIVGNPQATYIIRDANVNLLCGNGVCDPTESAWSCPVDCDVADVPCFSDFDCGENETCIGAGGIDEPGVCTSPDCNFDADCPTNFPICLGNFCVRGLNASFSCVFDSDCPINSPICFENFCVEGISGTTPSTVSPEVAINEEVRQSLANAIDMITGGHPIIKFIMGFVFIIAMVVAVATITTNAFVLTFVAIMSTIITTSLTLTPIAVPILMILIMIVIIFIDKFFMSNNNNNGS